MTRSTTRTTLLAGLAWRARRASPPGCRRAGGRPPARRTPGPRPNVLLVTIDTLRADHVGCYGRAQALDADPRRPRRARRPLRDRRRPRAAHRPVARVDPDRASRRSATASATTAATRCRATVAHRRPRTSGKAGYRTGGVRVRVPAEPPLRLRPRLRDLRRPPAEGQRPAPRAPRRALRRRHDRRRPALAGGARRAGPRPFFLWVHYYDPHAPYEPPRGVRRRASRAAPYDGEVAFVDQQLGAPAAAARRRRARSPAPSCSRPPTTARASASTARASHGLFVYDSTLRVPFLVAGPGRRRGPRGVDRRARHRRAADAPRPRRPRGPRRDRGPLAAAGARGARDERRACLRRDALPAARARLGAALRLAHGDATR